MVYLPELSVLFFKSSDGTKFAWNFRLEKKVSALIRIEEIFLDKNSAHIKVEGRLVNGTLPTFRDFLNKYLN